MPGQDSITGLARGTEETAVQQLQRVGRGECMGPRVSCCEEHRPWERHGAGGHHRGPGGRQPHPGGRGAGGETDVGPGGALKVEVGRFAEIRCSVRGRGGREGPQGFGPELQEWSSGPELSQEHGGEATQGGDMD